MSEFTALEQAMAGAEVSVSRTSVSGRFTWTDEEYAELKQNFIDSYMERWRELRRNDRGAA